MIIFGNSYTIMKKYIGIFLTCGEMAKGPTSSNEGRHVQINGDSRSWTTFYCCWNLKVMRSTWANASKRKDRDDGKSSLLKPPKKTKQKEFLVNNLGTLNPREGQRFGIGKIWNKKGFEPTLLAKSKIDVCDHKQIWTWQHFCLILRCVHSCTIKTSLGFLM